MILTITINPTLDKSIITDKLVPEKKMRCSGMKVEAGGGGINVSKAIKELGGESLAVFTSGGMNGKILEQIISDSGIAFHAVPVNGDTRENFSITEITTNNQYRFVMPGTAMSESEINSCLEVIKKTNPSIIVFSGSLPPNVPDEFPARIAAIAKEKKIKFIADTSGEPLRHILEQGVYLLKPNLSELSFLAGKDFLQLSEIDDAAKTIINKGHCEVIVVSMGPSGALLVTKNGERRIPAPTVKKLSTVGAGDSMVAGITWMLEENKTLLEAVQFGVACGTAAIMNQGTQLFIKKDAVQLFEWIQKNNVL